MTDTAAISYGNLSAAYITPEPDDINDPRYGTLNSTFPKNLLVAVGAQDVLFDLKKLKTKEDAKIISPI